MVEFNNINPNSIILVGFMGSGKTSVGRVLASKLGYSFYDTDEMISSKFENSISQIFENQGEQYFRILENQLTKELGKLQEVVISTGGGLPVFFDNMEMLNKIGQTIYLKNNVRELCNRLYLDKNRPLLTKYNTKSLLSGYIKSTLKDREHHYKKSKILIDCKNKTVEEIATEILNEISK